MRLWAGWPPSIYCPPPPLFPHRLGTYMERSVYLLLTPTTKKMDERIWIELLWWVAAPPPCSAAVTMALLVPQYVPNEYAYQCAKEFPDMCVAVGSVNPYRTDAIQELENCAANGVTIIKWLVSHVTTTLTGQ